MAAPPPSAAKGSRMVRRPPSTESVSSRSAGLEFSVFASGKSSSYTRRVMCGMARSTSTGAVLTLMRPGVSLPS